MPPQNSPPVAAPRQSGEVAGRYVEAGRRKGDVEGPGGRLAFRGIDVIRVEGGRVLNRRGESNAAEPLGSQLTG